ncbi:DNA-directed RNA polymerase II core subunit rpb9 [Rhizina undulata]
MSERSSPAPESAPSAKEKVSFRFCRECSNMLYPHEDRVNNVLMYRCRTCQATEPASNYCVFRNVLANNTGETAGVTTDVGTDPTLPKSNKVCPQCGESEAVFFQSQQRRQDTKMRLFHVCCSCGTIH